MYFCTGSWQTSPRAAVVTLIHATTLSQDLTNILQSMLAAVGTQHMGIGHSKIDVSIIAECLPVPVALSYNKV